MRFLMKTLMVRPAPRLINAFRQNPLWMRSSSRCRLRVLCEAGLGNLALTDAAYIGLMDLLPEFNRSQSSCYGHARTNRSLLARVCTPSLTVLYPYIEQRQG